MHHTSIAIIIGGLKTLPQNIEYRVEKDLSQSFVHELLGMIVKSKPVSVPSQEWNFKLE